MLCLKEIGRLKLKSNRQFGKIIGTKEEEKLNHVPANMTSWVPAVHRLVPATARLLAQDWSHLGPGKQPSWDPVGAQLGLLAGLLLPYITNKHRRKDINMSGLYVGIIINFLYSGRSGKMYSVCSPLSLCNVYYWTKCKCFPINIH